MNTMLLTDVYKMGHMEQYPDDTVEVYSYLEARKPGNEIVFFGLQYILRKYLSKPVTYENGEEFLRYFSEILGEPSFEVRRKVHDLVALGHWPVSIKAVPEGTILPTRNILLSIRNTLPGYGWCVGFVESLLLKLWNPCTIATYSRKYRNLVQNYSDLTCDNSFHVPFQVHDFGYRGVSSEETAAISGAAHLLNFQGSDTIPAAKFLDKYYQAYGDIKMQSVPASEHSVMCSYGREGEYAAFDRMLELYPQGIVSIVSDTYDYFKILTDWAVSNREQIVSRNGKVVFRPDSGDPLHIICGNPDAASEAERNGSLELLWDTFGGSVNEKGYRVLAPSVGLIYGDGMYFERFEAILGQMKKQGFASSNLVIGVGGILLQNHNRDEFGFALKATRIVRKEGGNVEIFKDPATDPSKKSKRGLMRLDLNNGVYSTVDQVTDEEEAKGELVEVFRDGRIVKGYSFREIKERLNG